MQLIFIGAFAQQEDSLVIKRMADEILTNGMAYDNLRYLCKKIGPRLSGSAQGQEAVEATVKMLKEAGADTIYLQPLHAASLGKRSKKKLGISCGPTEQSITLIYVHSVIQRVLE